MITWPGVIIVHSASLKIGKVKRKVRMESESASPHPTTLFFLMSTVITWLRTGFTRTMALEQYFLLNLSKICIAIFLCQAEIFSMYAFHLDYYKGIRATYTCVLEKHSSLVFKRGWPDMPQVSRYSCGSFLSMPGSQSFLMANLHHKRRISKQKMAVFFDPSLVKQQIVTASVLAE